ncbi:MAG: sulfatase [Planctomycetota bacterium]
MLGRTRMLCLLIAGALNACNRARAPRPDILLISIDSLRSDHLGCYGYAKPTSPRIDRLAAEGVRCETAITTTSWTLPAHAAMFTGLFDSAHGVVDNGLALAPGHRTLAELLKEDGYRTAGFFGGPYLHPVFGLGQGFDHYESCMSAMPSDDAVLSMSQQDVNASHRDVTGPRTLDAFTRWLDGTSEEPLFAFVHLWDVHYDYIPPPEYAQLFDPDYTGSLDASNLKHNQAIEPKMAPRDLQHLIALYDGEIRFTDDVIAKMLAALEKKGRLSNTLVVITADHGQEFFEHGGKGHQTTLHEELVRVPLVFWWPKELSTARVVHDQVRLVDVLPTILALASVDGVPRVQGRDIGPLLRGETLPPAPALCELYADAKELSAVRTNALKVYRNRRTDGVVTGGFDLAADPGERADLRNDARVQRGLADLQLELGLALEFHTKLGHGVRKIDVDADMQRRLGTLGYTDGDGEKPK